MNGPLVTRVILSLLALATLPLHAAPPAQLVQLRHGRVVRALAMEQEGNWVTLTLDGGHTLGIPAELVTAIEPDLNSGTNAGQPTLNVVTSGRYVPTAARPAPSQAPLDVEQQPAAPAEALNAPQELATPPPEEGLNLTPAAGARRRGLATRSNKNN
jgi:hypothetical protein